MRTYLLLGIGLALASCAAQKALPQYTEAEQTAQRGGISYWQPDPTPADSTPLLHRPPVWSPKDSLRWALHKQAHQVDSIVVERTPTFLDKVLHRTPKPYTVAVTPARIGKKSTVNVYLGPATVTTAGKKAQVAAGAGATASVIGKKAGPAQVASDSSTQNALLGGGNLAAVQGDGNRLEQKDEKPPEKSLLQSIWDDFKPALLIVAGVLGLGAIAFTFINTPAGPWLVALFKPRNPSDNNA